MSLIFEHSRYNFEPTLYDQSLGFQQLFLVRDMREGEAALNNVLLDLMDEAVRGEVVRQKGNTDSDVIDETKPGYMSPRQVILYEMGVALEEGDIDKAKDLREKFAKSTKLKADPTQTDGSYDKYLDQDDWYLEQRRRAMAPKKK